MLMSWGWHIFVLENSREIFCFVSNGFIIFNVFGVDIKIKIYTVIKIVSKIYLAGQRANCICNSMVDLSRTYQTIRWFNEKHYFFAFDFFWSSFLSCFPVSFFCASYYFQFLISPRFPLCPKGFQEWGGYPQRRWAWLCPSPHRAQRLYATAHVAPVALWKPVGVRGLCRRTRERGGGTPGEKCCYRTNGCWSISAEFRTINCKWYKVTNVLEV